MQKKVIENMLSATGELARSTATPVEDIAKAIGKLQRLAASLRKIYVEGGNSALLRERGLLLEMRAHTLANAVGLTLAIQREFYYPFGLTFGSREWWFG